MLRRRADIKTLIWIAIMPIVAGAQYFNPDLLPYLSPVSFYLALAAGVMAHNHNHCPTFKNKVANRAFGNWLSLFYGYPTFAWIPTHNNNHHKFLNKEGDATITWRHNNNHGFITAVTYFFVSSYYQGGPISAFIKKAKTGNRTLYKQIMFQYALWAGTAVTLAVVAIWAHGVATGLKVWLFASVLPAVFSLWTIMLFNYEQHVHTDPWSKHNHSRSWTSPILNFMLFNNGFHAAHHENAGTHWSDLPAVHARIAPDIDPRLIENGMWWYFAKNYALGLFIPKYRTKQLGRAPFDPPAEMAAE